MVFGGTPLRRAASPIVSTSDTATTVRLPVAGRSSLSAAPLRRHDSQPLPKRCAIAVRSGLLVGADGRWTRGRRAADRATVTTASTIWSGVSVACRRQVTQATQNDGPTGV